MRKLVVGLFCLLFLQCGKDLSPFGGPPEISPLPPRIKPEWPTAEWKVAKPESVGISGEKLKLVSDYAFLRTGDETDRKGRRTDALVVIRNGKIILEQYARNFDQNSLHLTWSVSKSIIQALYGITVKNGLVKLDDPGYYHFEPLAKDEAHKKITIRHLLNMSSGLDAEEGYESGPLKSSVIAMLYTRGRKDMGQFCSELPLRAEPGTRVYYSSCDTNILSAILKKVYGKEAYEELPYTKLFAPLGIKEATFEQDGSGTFVGSSYLYLTARDLAKIGYLYLNDGVWEGNRLLPEGWVDFTRTPAPGYKTTPYSEDLPQDNYTSHWYANTGVPERGVPEPWPDAPKDTFAGLGHWGQMLYVIPSLDIIIVRYGDDREKTFIKNDFLKLVKESVVR
ncbi:serine hydrolase domain-containing protein [Leptospira idonii]|uniref:Class C beta-lactamase-related serine hydrolase n=1 Tax=Leptospira idonii TaxID=1193500 RepID=A0A4R9M2C4_9LEPT|nr:serine hydrolase [Leptospira idonii]TGN19459.1 class C beta-lactamase-related serine hydrolase [Leptospira idonii]